MPLDANDSEQFAKDVDQYLRAAYAVARRADGYRGGTAATQALVAIVTTFLTDIIGAWPTPSAVARIRNNTPKFAALPDVPPTLAPVIELPRRDHDCNGECSIPCPMDDEDPRAWRG
jgi:hypothetical protein